MSETGPDIARPKPRVTSVLRRHWWWIGLVVAAAGIVAAAVVAKRLKTPTAGPALHIPQGIDAAFYLAPEPVPMGEPKEKEAAPPPPPKAPPPPPKPPLTAAVAFKTEAPPPPPPPPPPDPAEAINKARRGSSIAKVSMGAGLERPEAEASVDIDWNETKSEASYPLDMSRVIPVTRRISAILVEAIDSTLSGKCTAQVESNVYGGHGRNILIPAGSQAVCRYKKISKQGEERIEFMFPRLITTEGINIHMGDAELADAMGRSGLTGEVDTRFFDRYGMALLTASLGVAGSYALPVKDMGTAVVVQQYGGATMGLSNQILQQNVVLAPKVLIAAGARILISPSKDIWFKPPKGASIEAVALDEGGKRK